MLWFLQGRCRAGATWSHDTIPSYPFLSILGKAGKDLVVISSYIVTYGYHGAVNIGDSRTTSEGKELHEQHQPAEHSWHEFNKAVIGNCVGQILTHYTPLTQFKIILLEIAICAEMIVYQNGHNPTFQESGLAVSVAPIPAYKFLSPPIITYPRL